VKVVKHLGAGLPASLKISEEVGYAETNNP